MVSLQNEQKKILQIGLQFDADQYLIPEQGKYDIDGPKNLYDSKMMIDWHLKVIQEHPLVTYLEDGIRTSDNAGWQ